MTSGTKCKTRTMINSRIRRETWLEQCGIFKTQNKDFEATNDRQKGHTDGEGCEPLFYRLGKCHW